MSDEDMLPFGSSSDDTGTLQQLAAIGGAPAFMVRAARTQEALERVLRPGRHQRGEWLQMVRLRLGTVHALAGDWPALRPLLADEQQLKLLQQLYADLQPCLKAPPAPTASQKILRRALLELLESLEYFNQRWRKYLHGVDLTHVNQAREKYNKYYLLEKECVVRSPALARREWRPLEPVAIADLFRWLPLLPVPVLAG